MGVGYVPGVTRKGNPRHSVSGLLLGGPFDRRFLSGFLDRLPGLRFIDLSQKLVRGHVQVLSLFVFLQGENASFNKAATRKPGVFTDLPLKSS